MAQHTMTPDNLYVYPLHDGVVLGIDRYNGTYCFRFTLQSFLSRTQTLIDFQRLAHGHESCLHPQSQHSTSLLLTILYQANAHPTFSCRNPPYTTVNTSLPKPDFRLLSTAQMMAAGTLSQPRIFPSWLRARRLLDGTWASCPHLIPRVSSIC